MKFIAKVTTAVNPPSKDLKPLILKEGQEIELISIGEYRAYKPTLDRLAKGGMIKITDTSYPTADELKARSVKKTHDVVVEDVKIDESSTDKKPKKSKKSAVEPS